MSVTVTKLQGIDHNTAKALKGLGVKDSDQLLESAAKPAQRKELFPANPGRIDGIQIWL